MALAAPFARGGRQVDLSGSDRMARRRVFRPQPLAEDAALAFLLQELPAFEIPPWPRPRRETPWSLSPADAARR